MPHLNVIMTPLHVHGVRSEAEYRDAQLRFLQQTHAARPALPLVKPWLCLDKPSVIVSGGKWVVWCSCGNAPSVDPAIGLALCFECGAQYVNLTMPDAWQDIEDALVARPDNSQRHWRGPETVADLHDENVARGLPQKGKKR